MRSKKAVLAGILGVAVLGSTYVASTAQAHDDNRCFHNGSVLTDNWNIIYDRHEWVGSSHYHYYDHYYRWDPIHHREVNECSSAH